MKGMIYVETEGIAEDEQLSAWIGKGLSFVATLPDKKPAVKGRKK